MAVNFSPDGKLIGKGVIHGIAVFLLIISFCFFARLSSLNESVESIAGIIFIITIGLAGYFWKKENGKTFSMFDMEANMKLFWYSFGIAIVLIILITIRNLEGMISLGPWWPLFMSFLIPFGLVAQALNIASILSIGGWFYKKASNKM